MQKLFERTKKSASLVLKRPKGFNNYCFDLFSALTKAPKGFGLPVHVTIEPTNICNLQCPVCETGAGILKRPGGMMSLSVFKHIIDSMHPHINSLLFYYMGEPFLNPDSYGMIKYAKAKKIYMTTCTNGHFVDAAKLLDCGIDEVSFQIGGITEDSHRKYRVGSRLEDILKNIRAVLHQKKTTNEKHPKVILGIIVMQHNESEIEGFFKFARGLGVDEARLLNPCVRTWEQGKEILPNDKRFWIYDSKAFDRGLLRPKRVPSKRCNWMYFSTVILYNGDIVPCCRDVHGEYVMGNILRDDFPSVWNSKKYRAFRESIRQKQGELKICRLCPDYAVVPGLCTTKTS